MAASKPIDMFDMYETLALSDNWDTLKREKYPELSANFTRDPKTYRVELLGLFDKHFEQGDLTFKLFSDVLEALKKRQGLDHLLGVFSTGTERSIAAMVDALDIRKYFAELIPVPSLSKTDKNDPESFKALNAYLRDRGYALETFTDDKENFARAAAKSGVVPAAYHINRKATLPIEEKDGIYVVNSLANLRS